MRRNLLAYSLICFFVGTPVLQEKTLRHGREIPKKVTIDRLRLNSLKYLSAFFKNLRSANCAQAKFSDYESSDSIGSCDCASFTNSAELWNDCMSCLLMGLLGSYNTLADAFSNYIDPDIDVNNWLPVGDQNIAIYASDSAVEGYDRYTRLSDYDSGGICMSLHYSKGATDTTQTKGILHIMSQNCPGLSDADPVAAVVLFDLGYTTSTLQTVSVIIASEDGSGTFDISDVGGDDMAIYESISVDSSTATPITTAHSMLLQQDTFIKLFIQGEDDVLLRTSEDGGLGVADTDVDEGTMTSNNCFDDSSNTDLGALDDCNDAGFAFENFPLTVQTLGAKAFPEWTTSTLEVEADTAIEDYFP